jgi:tetratricopeptide (TPR) repeat protein
MNLFLLSFLALLCIGCATSPQTDSLVRKHKSIPEKFELRDVPFYEQNRHHCGPATLKMVLENLGRKVSINELNSQMYTSGMKGTFQTEMLSAARRQGMLAIPVNSLAALLKEIASGHPVIVFQNLGLGFFPRWHYAVATGYDIDGPDMFLHTGRDKFEDMDMRMFERSWRLAGYWGLLVLRPDQLSESADEQAHSLAAVALEDMGKFQEAQLAYETILSRWPQSLTPLIGLGNISYAHRDFKGSIGHLKKATQFHPHSAEAWHNLATAQGTVGLKEDAKISSLKALELVSKENKEAFKESLKAWLN